MSFVRDRYGNGSTRTAKSLVAAQGNFCSKKLELLFFSHNFTDSAGAGMEGAGGKLKSGVVGGPVTYEM